MNPWKKLYKIWSVANNIVKYIESIANERNRLMKSVRLNIEGLEQNETQDRVKDQLEGIIGVYDVCVSEGQTYLSVNYDEQTSVQEINNHLQNNGYKVTDIDD